MQHALVHFSVPLLQHRLGELSSPISIFRQISTRFTDHVVLFVYRQRPFAFIAHCLRTHCLENYLHLLFCLLLFMHALTRVRRFCRRQRHAPEWLAGGDVKLGAVLPAGPHIC